MPTSSDPVMDKLTEIMKTMTTMPTKKDLESFATKADINTLRSEVTKHVERDSAQQKKRSAQKK